MKNSLLFKYFITFFLPVCMGAQSTSSTASISIHLGDFHQMALPEVDGQMVFLNNNSKSKLGTEEGDAPIFLSSTGVFNLFARTASQDFSTLNLAYVSAQTLLDLEIDGTEIYGRQLAVLKNSFDINFRNFGTEKVSTNYIRAIKNKELIVASQSLIGYGKPEMNKALKFKYIVSSKEALDFLKETDVDSAEKAVIYTITSN